MSTNNTAIILAGGSGTRAGFDKPKQFIEISGRTMLERSVDAFEANPDIESIVIVSNAMFVAETRALVERNKWYKLTALCSGGASRFASANAGLASCPATSTGVLIHDAARPLVSQRIISDVAHALLKYSAVDVAVPSTDSLILSDGNTVSRYIPRDEAWNVQTPQGFRIGTIFDAYSEALRHEDFNATDDCSLVRKYLPDVEVALVKGDNENIKLTYPHDKERMEEILKSRQQ